MANYLTSVGVQQVSITIANGSASQTATISSVGTLAFILFEGSTSTIANDVDSSGAVKVTLTNSTTVTATRTGNSGTTIVNCSVIDASSDLVSSVQFGTVTLTATQSSNTATITGVNSNSSALHFLGYNTTDTTTAPTTQNAALTYSSTTVTATVTTAVTSTMVVSFCMIEFNITALQSNVQVLSKSWLNSATTTTQSVTSVDVNNTLCVFAGQQTTSLTAWVTSKQRGTLTNGTTFTITVNTAASDTNIFNFTLVEFKSQVLNQVVQRGSINVNGATSATATIASVNVVKSILNKIGFSTNVTRYDRGASRDVLTNGTTVTATKSNATSASVTSYEVLEFSSGFVGSSLMLMGMGS